MIAARLPRRARHPTTQGGFTYIAILIAVAVMGTGIAATADVWHTTRQREKERELLFIGHQFREAIERYYLNSPGSIKEYPRELEDLLKDPRYPGIRRYLRKLYRDPFTGEAEWGLVLSSKGELLGVRSLSDTTPLKRANFEDEDNTFSGATTHAGWAFVYRPRATLRTNPQSAGRTGPGGLYTPAP